MMNPKDYYKLVQDEYRRKKLEELQYEADKKRFNIEKIRKNYPWIIGEDLDPGFSKNVPNPNVKPVPLSKVPYEKGHVGVSEKKYNPDGTVLY